MRLLDSRRVLALAGVALSMGAASCHRADSIVLVEVSGDLKLMPAAFAVVVTPGQSSGRNLWVTPPRGGAITLPASFTIQLPGDMTGPLTVAVQAVDASQAVVAQGTATQQLLHVGGQTILPVTITATGNIAITTPDAGRPVDAGARVDAHLEVDARAAVDAHAAGDVHPAIDARPARDARADAPRDTARVDAAVDAAAHLDAAADAARVRDAGGQS